MGTWCWFSMTVQSSGWCWLSFIYIYIYIYILHYYIHSYTYTYNLFSSVFSLNMIIWICFLGSPGRAGPRPVASFRWKPLLPLLQALDTLLSTVTWRERFVSTCLSDHPQKDLVEFWAENHLRGLRWQAVSDFCQAVACLLILIFMYKFDGFKSSL